jgi:LacI family transcriptional regulator
MATGMSPTLSDIANEVGVSVMTVSRALADRPGVAADTKQRVLEAARRLGYTVNQSVRSPSRNGTATIGVLVNNIGSEYIHDIIDGISNTLDMASYDIVIYNPYRMRRQPDDYVFVVAQKPMDGLIIAAANILQSVDYLDQLCQQRFPIVFVDQCVEGTCIPYVTANNYQGAYDATRYLIQLGHQRIGIVAGPLRESPSGARLTGYRDALTQYAIANDESLVQYGDFTRQSGFACARELLSRDRRPTAIFASNDPMAFGAMQAIRQMGLRIPEDISIIGFDDIGSSSDTLPPLTTVRQPLREMGRVGAQMILDMLRGHPHLPKAELQTSLIRRDSCAPLR